MMKDFCITLALIIAIGLSAQGAFAAWDCTQPPKTMSYISYLNPLQYIGIGENKTNFSLNPFTGFKNCNKCKLKRTACNECAKIKVKTCPSCRRAFIKERCASCAHTYMMPVVTQPRCTSCGY